MLKETTTWVSLLQARKLSVEPKMNVYEYINVSAISKTFDLTLRHCYKKTNCIIRVGNSNFDNVFLQDFHYCTTHGNVIKKSGKKGLLDFNIICLNII